MPVRPTPAASRGAPTGSDPATLVAEGVTVERGARLVLDAVSVVVPPASRIGVVGPNGVGKTTLLRVLAGLDRPDAGSVTLAPPGATVGYLAQEHDGSPTETVRRALHHRTGLVAAEDELSRAAEALAAGHDDGERYALALERFTRLAGGDLDARIDARLLELGLPDEVAELPTAALSGGQAARVALAAVLLARFDITLLDEPTNDLDFDGLERLEAAVAAEPGAVVVVSHDREFLDRTVTSVLEIDERGGGARLFRGGWRAYLEERATTRRHAEEAFETYTDRRRQLADRARREREWATSAVRRQKRQPRDNDKAQQGFRINRTEHLAARARRTERAIDRLEVVEKPWEGWELRYAIGVAPRAGAVVARLDGAVLERGTWRLGPVEFEIGWGERVLLAGPNGSGKSSLVAAILGRLPLAAGSRYLGPGVVLGELDQRRALGATGGATLLDAVAARGALPDAEVRSLLAKFGLGAGHVGRPPTSLSPGERTRAELALFQARGVNFLVLDEPTNHLDLPAIEQLEAALGAFTGTLLLVSHDRRLLDTVHVTRRVDAPALRAER